jgi:hypothetical protein
MIPETVFDKESCHSGIVSVWTTAHSLSINVEETVCFQISCSLKDSV